MLDYVKVIWKSWNKVPNQTYRVIKDNQFRVFRSMEEANEFIKELEQTPGIIHIHKETHEFFRVNDIQSRGERNEIYQLSPQLIGKGHYGIWRVTAHYTNGIIHEQDCIAHTATEAKWKYLHIHGRVQGTISAESVRDLTSPFLFRK